MKNDLKEIIKDKQDIEAYLGDVTTCQFIEDIKELMKKQADKSAIEEAIKRLQELI